MSEAAAAAPAPRLKERYDAEIRTRLKDELHLANIMQVPRFEKIVINMGVGRATQQASLLEGAVNGWATPAGNGGTTAVLAGAAVAVGDGGRVPVVGSGAAAAGDGVAAGPGLPPGPGVCWA